ncbi:MAG: gamma-glutamyltransferase [Pseudomonadota bacterium]
MRVWFGWTIAGLLTAGAAMAQTKADPEGESGFAPKPVVAAERHMVAAAHPLAAEAGLAMLRAGGSAADAAIATLLALTVVEPQSSGLGGGAFALVHGPDGLTSWDARETAPAAAMPELFLEGGEPLHFLEAVASGRSVGVPGLMRLIEALYTRHGKLPWGRLLAPAIQLAERGFSVSPRLAASVERSAGRLAASDAAAVFLPGGRPLAEGESFRQPALAETLRTLAAEGPGAFYEGAIAEAIIAAVGREPRPGALSLDDLAAYQAVEREPVCLDFRDRWRVCGMGPPSSGATTVGQILGLMERFDLAGLTVESPRLWHLFAESSRLAYADRARFLADPDQVSVPVKGLLFRDYLAERARLISLVQAAEGKAEAGDPPWREGRQMAPDAGLTSAGTTHLSVIDESGLALSITASIETAFGSGRMAAGFLLNNQLTDFSFRPTGADGTPIANAPAPGKRPRSSMAPSIVYWTARPSQPHLLVGSPGGSRIPEYVAQSLLGLTVLRLDPAEAAALPHISQRNRGGVVLEEGRGLGEMREGLQALGHDVSEAPMTSGLHIIRIGLDGELEGGADPRREGVALGD